MRRVLGLLCVVLVVRAKNQCDVSTVDFVNVQETVINNTTSGLINGSSSFAKLPVDEELIQENNGFEEFDDYPREDARCLENVTRCAEEDGLLAAVTERITKKLFTLAPPFDLSTVPGISTECNRHSATFREELQRLHLWALKMYDSTAKLSSGILDGNVNQFGDFDQCLSVKADDTGSTKPQVRGQYCLAYMQVEIPDGPYMSLLHKLSHANYAFRSQLNDPGHRVPRFSSINWAVCVPAACTSRDVEVGVRHYVARPLSELGVQVQVQVNKEMCASSLPEPLPLSTIVGGCFFAAVILLTLASTLYDYRTTENKNECMTAFSLIKNTRSLVSLERSPGDIPSVHGIRFLNAFMLIMAHKSMAIFFNPYVNRTDMSQQLGQPWSVLGRAASLYTDPFIMLSGMLTAHSFLGRLGRGQCISVAREYAARLFRLVPTLGALIMFCTLVLPWLGSGPQWNLVVTHHSDICKSTWWRNLLFIHNYFGFENMCLTHTHHVGIDTQLFAFSPLMVWLVWRWPRGGAATLAALATLSTAMRYYVTYTRRLSNFVHFGTSIKQLFDTADHMYILPAHRLTVYIMGVLLAQALRSHAAAKLKPLHLQLGNVSAVVLFCLAFFGPAYMGSIHYRYEPADAAWYAAFAPIAWCASFGWVIYTAQMGHTGAVSRFFSARIFLISTRLSYAIYLTQFPVFFYNVGVTRSAEQYSFVRMQFNLPELLNILLYSVVLTLLFDTPFQNIKNILLGKHSAKIKSK